MPVVFVPHGGGPWPFADVGLPKDELEELAAYLRSVEALPKTPPKALLVISAHWEEKVPTVMTSPSPPMLYDYYGFPAEAYEVKWPAPGSPELAKRVQELLAKAGIESAADDQRGFDHGTFVPLKVTYPEPTIPAVQLSLKANLDPADHLAIGRALAPLRDEGVLIVGSGLSFHNMGVFRARGNPAFVQSGTAFDDWLKATITATPEERNARLTKWADAPGARVAHPREEHFFPLLVVAGAAGDDRGTVPFNGKMLGIPISAAQFG